MSSSKKSKGKHPLRRVVIAIGLVGVCAALIWGYVQYTRVYKNNVELGEKKSAYVCIPTGSDFASTVSIFKESGYIKDFDSFERYANVRGYFNEIFFSISFKDVWLREISIMATMATALMLAIDAISRISIFIIS